MKKIILVLLIFAVFAGSAFAFDILSYPTPLEGGGNLLIDAGVGLTFYSGYGKMSIPPLFANVEYTLPVNVPISVGGFFAFFQYKYTYSGWDYGWRNTFFTFGARGNWHWGFDIKWLDFYTGIWMGYRYHKATWYGTDQHYSASGYSGFDLGPQVGAHFYFTDWIGVNVEAGYPFLLKAGIAFKLL